MVLSHECHSSLAIKWMCLRLKGNNKDVLDSRVGESLSHRNALIFITDADAILLPGDSGLGVPSWWDTLHNSWFTCGHHHVARRLPEVISQNYRERERESCQ